MCPLSTMFILEDQRVAYFLAHLFDTPLLLVASALALLPFVYLRRWRMIAFFLLALAFTYAATMFLKELFQFERPAGALFEEVSYRFPSGHTSAAAAFAAALWIIYAPWTTRSGRLVLALLAGSAVVATAATRVLVGVHCLPDVLFGAVIGILGTLAAAGLVFRKFPWRRFLE